MADSISQLLRKKYPNGTDIGRLFVETTVNDIKCWNKNKKTKHKYSQEMLNEAYFALSPDERKVFNYYGDIHDVLLSIYDRYQAYLQQFFSGYYRIIYTLREIGRAEDFKRRALNFKHFVKEDQIDSFLEEINENLLVYSEFEKSDQVEDIKEAYKLIDSALLDFESCMEYMCIIEQLYAIPFGDIKDFFIEATESYLKEMNDVLAITEVVVPSIKKYFKTLKYDIFVHEESQKDFRYESELYKEWISSNKVFSDLEKNNFVKRNKIYIEEIKKELSEKIN